MKSNLCACLDLDLKVIILALLLPLCSNGQCEAKNPETFIPRVNKLMGGTLLCNTERCAVASG